MNCVKCGMVAVVGSANVGKSTLVNALVGEKVTIVSPVVQTTRNVVRAILTEPRGQLVFMDTPGVHKAQYDLGRLMNRMARQTAVGADAVLLVLDAGRPPREEDEGWMRRLLRPDAEGVLMIALNKSDMERNHAAAYHDLWRDLQQEKGREREPVWLTLSALQGKGVVELTTLLFETMPAGPHLFPADVLTDYPKKLNMADVIREKYVVRLKDELPHAIAVWIEAVDERDERWTVNGTVYVNRPSQKGIVLGAKGRLLKAVCHEAGLELSEMYERPVTVKLWVKCEADWARNFWMLRKLGYA
jgi:GTPase